MKYRYNFSYEDLSFKDNLLRGDILYSDSNDFELAIKEFKLKHPNCILKGVVITENT